LLTKLCTVFHNDISPSLDWTDGIWTRRYMHKHSIEKSARGRPTIHGSLSRKLDFERKAKFLCVVWRNQMRKTSSYRLSQEFALPGIILHNPK